MSRSRKRNKRGGSEDKKKAQLVKALVAAVRARKTRVQSEVDNLIAGLVIHGKISPPNRPNPRGDGKSKKRRRSKKPKRTKRRKGNKKSKRTKRR